MQKECKYLEVRHIKASINMKAIYILCSLAVTIATTAATKTCAPFPATMDIFTSGFEEPVPPLVKSKYNTSFIQHKW
ncbi:hypothetical protein TMatcc_004483 [Talaromyces marneffei ATCC 18224]